LTCRGAIAALPARSACSAKRRTGQSGCWQTNSRTINTITITLEAGFGMHEVAERLGHDPATLMRFYARVHRGRRASLADVAATLVTAGVAARWPNELSGAVGGVRSRVRPAHLIRYSVA
jgi:hypothetical protein